VIHHVGKGLDPGDQANSSKLAEMFARASSFNALVGMAVDVVSLFMALLSFRGIDTQSLPAQGEQRRPIYFNIDRDISGAASSPGEHYPQ
jgi:hypothetical protein